MSDYLLIGNPNVGKTTIFNRLTNSMEVVGNYSGVTVEKKVGKLFANANNKLLDLPGIYSINPSSLDEGVTTRVLINETYNGIINVCDVSSLKRHLHLTIQLLELATPMVLLLNFHDEFVSNKRVLDTTLLSKKLGIDVVETVGTDIKKDSDIISRVDANVKNTFQINYGDLEKYIKAIKNLIPHNKLKRRFLAIALLEGNEEVLNYIKQFAAYDKILEVLDEANEYLKTNTEFPKTSVMVFEKRKEFINTLLKECNYTSTSAASVINQKTYKIDKYLTNPLLGSVLFIAILLSIYYLTFNLFGNYITDFIESTMFGPVFNGLESMFSVLGISGILKDLLLEGLFTGVVSVLMFVPQVVILFLFLTLLESVGYLARASVLFDRVFYKVGLNGKSIIPIITGIGCNVPGIVGTRIISNKKERLMTILVLPFISCSARLPIYVIFVNTFFGNYAFVGLLLIQALGILIVIIVSFILNNTMFSGQNDYLVIELPPYRKPQLQYISKVTINKAKKFFLTVAKFVTIGTVAVWILSNFNFSGYNVPDSESFLANISSFISPIFAPLGFGTWQAASSILSGFMAKEVVVSTLSIVYNASESNLSTALLANFTTASAVSFVIFNALFIPCIATLGSIRQETGQWKWTFVSIGLASTVAYIVALIAYIIMIIIT